MTRTISVVLATILWCCMQAGTVSASTGEDTLAGRLPDNITVRLVAAATSPQRGQNRLARFVSVDSKGASRELVVQFPAHSHTTHEATLIQLIDACIQWSPQSGQSTEPIWSPARCDLTFSVPRNAGESTAARFNAWYLTRLSLP